MKTVELPKDERGRQKNKPKNSIIEAYDIHGMLIKKNNDADKEANITERNALSNAPYVQVKNGR